MRSRCHSSLRPPFDIVRPAVAKNRLPSLNIRRGPLGGERYAGIHRASEEWSTPVNTARLGGSYPPGRDTGADDKLCRSVNSAIPESSAPETSAGDRNSYCIPPRRLV
jgi:hypothetical protein